MKTAKKSQISRMFRKLQVEQRRSDHHISGFIVDDTGKKLFPPVFYSKGSGDVGLAVLTSLQKSLMLDKREFANLIGCRMSREEYLELRLNR